MVDLAGIKADLSKIKTEEEKLEYFSNLVTQMDKDDYNNERRHESHRDNFDISVLDKGTDEENTYIPSEITRLYQKQSFEEYIFSQKYEDLHQLPRYGIISSAVKEIPENRKEVLFLKAIWGYTESEIAGEKSVSQSSVSQLYKKAIDHIRIKIIFKIRWKTRQNQQLSKQEKLFYDRFYCKYIDKIDSE